MTNIDLSGYNLGELGKLQKDVEKAIKDRQEDEVQAAREQILTIAKAVGFSIQDIINISQKKSNNEKPYKAPPQYRNPDDNSQTWAGRGRQPLWIAHGLANGKNLDDFRIK